MRTVAGTLGQLVSIAGVAWAIRDLMQDEGDIKSLWFRFMVRPHIIEDGGGRLNEI